MKRVTIKVNVGDCGIVHYEEYIGYMLEDGRVVYVTPNYFQVWLVNVKPTDNLGVYVKDGGHVQLGIIREGGNEVYVIKRVIEMLMELTAYEFLTRYFDWRTDVDFDLIQER